MEDSLAGRIAQKVHRKLFGEYALGTNYDLYQDQKRPFYHDLLREMFPENHITPQIEEYTGATNPNNHIGMYLALLNSQNMKDCFLRRAFLGTLKEPTYRWFADLLARSITSFEELTFKFVTQHIGNIRIWKSTNSLNAIKQWSDTLRHYAT